MHGGAECVLRGSIEEYAILTVPAHAAATIDPRLFQVDFANEQYKVTSSSELWLTVHTWRRAAREGELDRGEVCEAADLVPKTNEVAGRATVSRDSTLQHTHVIAGEILVSIRLCHGLAATDL